MIRLKKRNIAIDTSYGLKLLALVTAPFVASCDLSKTETYPQGGAQSATIDDVPLAPGETMAPVSDGLVASSTTVIAGTSQSPADADLPAITLQRIADIELIAKAIEAYKVDNGSYPNSGGAYAAYKMSWGQSKGENWIPELVPKYIAKVPREPTYSEDPDGLQYLYASDGSYYKLIVHNADDCEIASRNPRMKRDPVRTRPDGTCWAYGLWSENGSAF